MCVGKLTCLHNQLNSQECLSSCFQWDEVPVTLAANQDLQNLQKTSCWMTNPTSEGKEKRLPNNPLHFLFLQVKELQMCFGPELFGNRLGPYLKVRKISLLEVDISHCIQRQFQFSDDGKMFEALWNKESVTSFKSEEAAEPKDLITVFCGYSQGGHRKNEFVLNQQTRLV